jgi:hypothetical protein
LHLYIRARRESLRTHLLVAGGLVVVHLEDEL